jgi:indolepyruvate ferredoxin oxidoreductase beta subunit
MYTNSPETAKSGISRRQKQRVTQMKNNIVIAGVGGQGILAIAAIIGIAAVDNELYIKQSEVHGMSQRGGDVQSHLRLSDKPVFSDLIPFGKADIIISMEPMECLRYLPWISKEGWLVTNSKSFINITDYPPPEEIIKEIRKIRNHRIVDADEIAKTSGSSRSGNIVILGAASHYIDIPFNSLEMAVGKFFNKKGTDITEINIKALRAGREA